MRGRPTRPCTRQGAEVWPISFAGGQSLRRALQVKAGVGQAFCEAMSFVVSVVRHGPRVSLGTSEWNGWRPIHLSRTDRLAYAMAPIALLAAFVSPQFLYPLLGVAFAAMTTVLIRNQQKPYFDATHLHARRGWLDLKDVPVPLETIDDVVVEPFKAMPDIGTINVRFGREYLECESVPNAEWKAGLLRKAVQRALAKGRTQ